MSQQDVQLVEGVFEAINRRDVQAVLDAYHPDADMSTLTSELVQGKAYRGHTGIREYFSSFADVWEELRLEPEEIRDLGDRILVVGRWSLAGQGERGRGGVTGRLDLRRPRRADRLLARLSRRRGGAGRLG